MDGLALIQGDGLYHYVDCGLDYVWLSGGVEFRDTPRGQMVKINDRNGLHAAIARCIVSSPARLRGQEVRFLRSMLRLSQEGLGKLLRQSRATIARWEGEPNKAIAIGSADWLRVVYTKQAEGDAAVGRLLDLLIALDEQKNGETTVREARFEEVYKKGWRKTRQEPAVPSKGGVIPFHGLCHG